MTSNQESTSVTRDRHRQRHVREKPCVGPCPAVMIPASHTQHLSLRLKTRSDVARLSDGFGSS